MRVRWHLTHRIVGLEKGLDDIGKLVHRIIRELEAILVGGHGDRQEHSRPNILEQVGDVFVLKDIVSVVVHEAFRSHMSMSGTEVILAEVRRQMVKRQEAVGLSPRFTLPGFYTQQRLDASPCGLSIIGYGVELSP